jgi:antitoxin ParD1/3/4
MPMQLPKELEALVQELMDSGMYLAPEEVVHDALWLLRDRHLLYKVKREELRALLDVGIQQAERGEVAPLDMEAIKAKAALRLQQEQDKDAAPCRK